MTEESTPSQPQKGLRGKTINLLFLIVFVANALTEPVVHPDHPWKGIAFFLFLSLIPLFNLFAPDHFKKVSPVVWILAAAGAGASLYFL